MVQNGRDDKKLYIEGAYKIGNKSDEQSLIYHINYIEKITFEKNVIIQCCEKNKYFMYRRKSLC